MSSIIPSVFPIDNNLIINEPFVDWLSFTCSANEAETVVSEFDSIFAYFGSTRDENGLYRFPVATGGYGTCKIDVNNDFYIFSLSGGCLAHLRQFKLMHDVLFPVSLIPHKITRLDVAADYDVPSYIAINELAETVPTGAVRLTRKAITQSQIKKILSVDRHGHETGTLYLGHRASTDVCCRIYDKAHEINQKTKFEAPQRLRIEFTFKGNVLPTLRDVDLPFDIYYHHASHSLVKAPVTVKPWVSYGQPYYIQKKPKKTPYQLMRGLFEYSTDISKLCAYAIEEFGDKAPDEIARLFTHRVKKSLRGMGSNPMQASLF